MPTIFRAKLRRLGNSMGVIIPKEIIEEAGLRGGDEVQISLPTCNLVTRNEKIMQLAGRHDGMPGFQREKGDRF